MNIFPNKPKQVELNSAFNFPLIKQMITNQITPIISKVGLKIQKTPGGFIHHGDEFILLNSNEIILSIQEHIHLKHNQFTNILNVIINICWRTHLYNYTSMLSSSSNTYHILDKIKSDFIHNIKDILTIIEVGGWDISMSLADSGLLTSSFNIKIADPNFNIESKIKKGQLFDILDQPILSNDLVFSGEDGVKNLQDGIYRSQHIIRILGKNIFGNIIMKPFNARRDNFDLQLLHISGNTRLFKLPESCVELAKS